MLVAKYEESSNNVWVATATVPTDILTNASFYLMMPARIYSSSQYDRGCLIQINNAAASINECMQKAAAKILKVEQEREEEQKREEARKG